MKIFHTVLLVISLLATAVPCAHAEEHAHHFAEAEIHTAVCGICHVCPETPCAKPGPFLKISAELDFAIPEPRAVFVAVFRPVHFIAPEHFHPVGELHCLQTVQLLI